MIFHGTKISDVFQIELEKVLDERGFFARSFSQDEFKQQGIDFLPTQTSISFNEKLHTLRGMHFQTAPDEEKKLVRCTKGKVFDVVIDLRPNSLTYRQWQSFELAAEEYNAIFIPVGCAHGFLSLTDDSELLYYIDAVYNPVAARGYRWDDPVFNIAWPYNPAVIAEKDKNWPDFIK